MRQTGDVLIFHIALESDWTAAKQTGEYRISTLGVTLDEAGFIHASFADQVELIAELAYKNITEPLIVLALNTTDLAAQVKVEPAPDLNQSFPHIYGPIPTTAVTNTYPLARGPAPHHPWTWPHPPTTALPRTTSP